MKNPILFISYSWDNEAHKEWVLNLANKLRSDGVDVILDRYYLRPGTNLSFFVEDSLRKANRILIILTPNYKLKAEKRNGGVGQEFALINNALVQNLEENDKVIPILKSGTLEESIPDFIQQYIYIDFTETKRFEKRYNHLLREIYEEPEIKIPKLGKKPAFDIVEKDTGNQILEEIKMLSKKLIASEYGKANEVIADIYELANFLSLNQIFILLNERKIEFRIAVAVCLKSISQNMSLDIGTNPNIRKFVASGMTDENSILRHRIFDLISASEVLAQDFYVEIQRQGLKETNKEVKHKIDSILNLNGLSKDSPKKDKEKFNLKELVKESVLKGNTHKAIELLLSHFSNNSGKTEQQNISIVLLRQFEDVKQGKILNTLTLDQITLMQNKINYSILNLVDEI